MAMQGGQVQCRVPLRIFGRESPGIVSNNLREPRRIGTFGGSMHRRLSIRSWDERRTKAATHTEKRAQQYRWSADFVVNAGWAIRRMFKHSLRVEFWTPRMGKRRRGGTRAIVFATVTGRDKI